MGRLVVFPDVIPKVLINWDSLPEMLVQWCPIARIYGSDHHLLCIFPGRVPFHFPFPVGGDLFSELSTVVSVSSILSQFTSRCLINGLQPLLNVSKTARSVVFPHQRRLSPISKLLGKRALLSLLPAGKCV